ncbi:transcriptional regulator, XRE family with cupin sensor [Polaromonas sp. OV174]|uniref:helix-turn-helix domain-containing protein n=1 Tax=Polaromonas sp. OV174 TaxID=1855300 RepID=UPI0008E1B7C9|nr:XRE family transcriptional regulator [Polaromonas sp. OV174]SFB68376.1 transcriptional regulator, XRE family with cupin sensor [Polaromonas sp. OV174]
MTADPAEPLPVASSIVLDKAELGARLRSARQAQQLTLAELARLSRVSVASISKAERGLLALSYEKFAALAAALQLDLSTLFGRQPAESVSGHAVVTRRHDVVAYHSERYLYGMLATQVVSKKMTPMIGRVDASTVLKPGEFSRHPGEEFIFVLEGTLEMHFADGRLERLEKHDSIYFDSNLGHLYVNGGERGAQILVVVCGQAQDAGAREGEGVLSNQ